MLVVHSVVHDLNNKYNMNINCNHTFLICSKINMIRVLSSK